MKLNMANYKETILTNLRDRSFTSVLVALAIWLIASQVILYFTYDVITNPEYCKESIKFIEKFHKCTKIVLANTYMTLLIPIGLAITSYLITRPKQHK